MRKLFFIIILLTLLLVSCKKETPTATPTPTERGRPTQTLTPNPYPEPTTRFSTVTPAVYPPPEEIKVVTEEPLASYPEFDLVEPVAVNTEEPVVVYVAKPFTFTLSLQNKFLPLVQGGKYPKDRFIVLEADGTPYLSEWGMTILCTNQPFECIGIPEQNPYIFYSPGEEYNIRFVVVYSEFWGLGNVYFLYPWEGCIQAEGGHVCVTSNGSLLAGTASEVTVSQLEDSLPIMSIDICYGLVDKGDFSPCNRNWSDPTPTATSTRRPTLTPRNTPTPTTTATVAIDGN